MPLTLTLKSELKLPIEVDGILPERLQGLLPGEIKRQEVWCGRTQKPLSDFFEVQGDLSDEATINWQGDLTRVHRLGQQMTSGRMDVAGSVGRHAGFRMSGGRIEIQGNANDYLGAEMTGGTIAISGDAADHVGSWFSGAKFGMNRGQIFIQGSAGNGVGQGMRRGTIIVGKQAGKLVGWNMLAGTIICFGGCGSHPGAGMKRGTIVGAEKNAAAKALASQQLLPTFEAGSDFEVPIFQYIKNWLNKEKFDSRPVFETSLLAGLDKSFRVFHGDRLRGGRGELFLATE